MGWTKLRWRTWHNHLKALYQGKKRISFGQPYNRHKTFLPKGAKETGKATGELKETTAPAAGESKSEITPRDTGVVYCSDSIPAKTRVDELLAIQAEVYFFFTSTFLKHVLCSWTHPGVFRLLTHTFLWQLNIRMQYEITTILGLEALNVDCKAAKEGINELNANLITKNN